ncbi:hypothetical protein KEM52_000943 [Ascosphaera acerosa]|nr:hypothetical protein KEM52_000943 [Ascosphaera acerosa]
MQLGSRQPSALALAASLLSLASISVTPAAAYELKGCYKKFNPLTDKGVYIYQAAGHCVDECKNYAVMAMTMGNDCACGDTVPAKSDKTDDDDCDKGCVGYPSDACGSDEYWSVYLTGNKKPKFATDDDDKSTSTESSTKTSTKTSKTSTATHTSTDTSTATTSTRATTMATSVYTTTSNGKTVAVTPTASPTSDSDSDSDSESASTATASPEAVDKPKKSNTAAIAAGVVVGVVGLGAIIGGVIFFMKKRSRMRVEEEYRRNAQLSDYVSGGAGGGAGAGAGREKFGHDQRLDASAQRRLSSGSIADEQDYSRRILKVANPDPGYY